MNEGHWSRIARLLVKVFDARRRPPESGTAVEKLAAPPQARGVAYPVAKLARHRQPVRAAVESMTGARFVHDTLEQFGSDVLIPLRQADQGRTAEC
jgi:hypothetical protein